MKKEQEPSRPRERPRRIPPLWPIHIYKILIVKKIIHIHIDIYLSIPEECLNEFILVFVTNANIVM